MSISPTVQPNAAVTNFINTATTGLNTYLPAVAAGLAGVKSAISTAQTTGQSHLVEGLNIASNLLNAAAQVPNPTVDEIAGFGQLIVGVFGSIASLFHPATASVMVTTPSAVAASGAATLAPSSSTTATPTPTPAATDQSAQIAALTAQNQQLQSELAALTAQMSQLTASTPQPAATVVVPPPSASTPAASTATVSTGTPATAPVAHTVTPNANPSFAEKLFEPKLAHAQEAAAAALKQTPVAIPTK